MNHINIKLIWRNLWKHAKISAINIFGLSVSLAVAMLIVLFLQYEFSFDKTNSNQAAIYRLNTTFKYPNSPERPTAMAAITMGPYLNRTSNDIDNYLRIITDSENFLCKAGNQQASIGKSLQADSSFFSFFQYPLLYGNKTEAFNRPENILLTRPVSEELFGKKNPVGQTMEYTFALEADRDTTVQYIVSAVFEELPKNSHLQFDALTPLDSRQYESWQDNSRWHGVITNTYFQMRPLAGDRKAIAAKFPNLLKKEMPNSEMVGLSLQPLSDIHLGSTQLEFDNNNYQKSDRKYMQALALVAIFILLISGINFANLSTVLAMRRVREVGVRKSLGATDRQVLIQFLSEAMLLSFIGGTVALFWVELLRQPFLSLLGKDIDLRFSAMMFLTYFGIILIIGLLAGIFPATQAAGYTPLRAFQFRDSAVSVKRPFVQRLVIIQFMLAGLLIIGSLISYQQLSFLQNKDLGFSYEQVVELNLGSSNWTRSSALKKDLAAIPGVTAVAGSDATLGTMSGQRGLLVKNQETGTWENFPMNIIQTDEHFYDLYDMDIIAGRTPTPEGANTGQEFIVNEAFIEKVGWKNDPIGSEIKIATRMNRDGGRVVGVIKNIHHNTLHHSIEPVCFQASSYAPIVSIKTNSVNIKEVLQKAQLAWHTHIKDRPFDYQFMDEHFAQLYQSESRLSKILLVATILSILIACIGLLALSAFIIQQRTKEIGIRKVLGASTVGIVGLLSKDFLKLVIIAFIIASPFAYFFMDNWLQDFAYRINIDWWVFVLAGLVAVTLAFLTVGFQSMKAAMANPVESLRSE